MLVEMCGFKFFDEFKRGYAITMECSKQYHFSIEGIARCDDALYFAARELNIIFKLNTEHCKTECLTTLPGEKMIAERLYNGILANEKKLLLVPFNAANIWLYDLQENQWEDISLENLMKPSLYGKFVGGIMKGEKAYLFGYYYNDVAVVDLKNKTVNNLLENEPREECSFWGQSVACKNESVYVANREKNEILKINLDNGTYKIIKTPYVNDVYIGITFDGTSFWIVPHYGSKIYKWDGGTDFQEVELSVSFGSEVGFFNGICAGKHYIILFSPSGKSCVIDKIEMKIEKIGDSIIYAEYLSNNEELQLEKKIAILIDEDLYVETMRDVDLSDDLIYEKSVLSLYEYLRMI